MTNMDPKQNTFHRLKGLLSFFACKSQCGLTPNGMLGTITLPNSLGVISVICKAVAWVLLQITELAEHDGTPPVSCCAEVTKG